MGKVKQNKKKSADDAEKESSTLNNDAEDKQGDMHHERDSTSKPIKINDEFFQNSINLN